MGSIHGFRHQWSTVLAGAKPWGYDRAGVQALSWCRRQQRVVAWSLYIFLRVAEREGNGSIPWAVSLGLSLGTFGLLSHEAAHRGLCKRGQMTPAPYRPLSPWRRKGPCMCPLSTEWHFIEQLPREYIGSGNSVFLNTQPLQSPLITCKIGRAEASLCVRLWGGWNVLKRFSWVSQSLPFVSLPASPSLKAKG